VGFEAIAVLGSRRRRRAQQAAGGRSLRGRAFSATFTVAILSVEAAWLAALAYAAFAVVR
jgi:hypothetical protein